MYDCQTDFKNLLVITYHLFFYYSLFIKYETGVINKKTCIKFFDEKNYFLLEFTYLFKDVYKY